MDVGLGILQDGRVVLLDQGLELLQGCACKAQSRYEARYEARKVHRFSLLNQEGILNGRPQQDLFVHDEYVGIYQQDSQGLMYSDH